jgi:hypothetical protein
VCNIQIVHKDEQNQEADLMIEIVIGLLAAAALNEIAHWVWTKGYRLLAAALSAMALVTLFLLIAMFLISA